MNTANLEKQFARLGAQLVLRDQRTGFSVDVARERNLHGFAIALGPGAEASVSDVQPGARHLLLTVHQETGPSHKFLCGHDERDWFAAAVPDLRVSSVRGAMEALKPRAVREAVLAKGVKRQHRNRRRNAAFVRQGEWFFLPSPEMKFAPLMVLHHEPLVRGRGKPHVVEFVVRTGGQLVYVSREYPRGLSDVQYRRLITEQPAKKNQVWRTMRRNPKVYARGRVRHPDHKTIHLDVWHLVAMNTENQAASMRHLMFLD